MNASTTSGYGSGGYGEGPYGHPEETDDTEPEPAPDPEPEPEPEPILTIARFGAAETNPNGPHVTIETRWEVTDTAEKLSVVTITITRDDGASIGERREKITGGVASGTWTYRVRKGTGSSYTVEMIAETSDGRRESVTQTIPRR